MKTRRLLWGIVAYLCVAAAVWFGLGSLNFPFFQRLATEGVRTEATVSVPDCGNHNRIRYTFQADGQTIAGIGLSGVGNPPCKQLRAGDRLAIWYVPADPAINLPGEHEYWLENERRSVGLAAMVIAAIVVGIFFQATRRRPPC